MPFKKGRKKTGGRTKGSMNKSTAIIKTYISFLLDDPMGKKFKEEFNKLKGKDYVLCYLKIAEIMVDENAKRNANEYLLDVFNNQIKEHHGTN